MIREIIQEAKGVLDIKKTEKTKWQVLKDGKVIGNINAIPADDRYEYYFETIKGVKPEYDTFDVKFDRLLKDLNKVFK